jgi:transposase-like protein
LSPTDDAAFNLLYLPQRNITKKWKMPIPHWSQAR